MVDITRMTTKTETRDPHYTIDLQARSNSWFKLHADKLIVQLFSSRLIFDTFSYFFNKNFICRYHSRIFMNTLLGTKGNKWTKEQLCGEQYNFIICC